jgi:hypothetical protein
MSARRTANSDWRRVVCWPLLLAGASGVGFVAAFISADAGRDLCWVGVGLPVIVIAGLMIRHIRQP